MSKAPKKTGSGISSQRPDLLYTTAIIQAICGVVTCILVITLLSRQSRLEYRLTRFLREAKALPSPDPKSPAMAGLVPVKAEPKPAPNHEIQGKAAPAPAELDEPIALGQSVGLPRDGSLFDGIQFEPGPGYLIRHPGRAWGTREAIAMIRSALDKTRRDHPYAVPLLVGDLSTRTGGPLSGHNSHQSGRDVDLGLFRRALAPLRDKQKRHVDPKQLKFKRATKNNMQLPVLLDFLIALHEHKDEPGGIQWIMLDYKVQEWLVDYANNHDYEPALIQAMFQVPHGPAYQNSLVRHYPGHLNHMHLRFSCPASDPYCQAPPQRADLREEP